MQKNVSGQKIGAQLVSATDGSNFTGSVTVYVTGDAGTQAAGSVGAGACTHEGNGYHTYAPAQAETNYDLIAFTFTGTGAISTTVQVYTGYPQTGDSFARLGAPAGASVSADVAAVKVDTAAILVDTGTTLQADITAILADTNELQADWANGGRLDLILDARASQTSVDTIDGIVDSILVDTAEIGAAGAGLTALPWNAAWDAEVQSECTDALDAYDPPTNTEMVAAFTEIKGATWSVTDTLEAIRDRGDAAWTTATGFSTLDAAGVRTAVGLATANLDTQLADLPTVAEFEARTLLAASYFDPAVDVVARVTLVDTTTTNTDMRGTNSAATAAALATAQADLDILTGSDGATLATLQPNYAPYTGTPPTVAQIRTEIDSNSTQLAAIVADTNELQTDWANGGRLDLILDARASQTSVDDLPTYAELSAALAAADDAVLAAIAALNNLSAAQVNAEVVDALATDTYAEPGSVPAATASLKDKLGWLMALARNKITQTSTTQTLRNDADDASIATATVSDNGTTATRGEWA